MEIVNSIYNYTYTVLYFCICIHMKKILIPVILLSTAFLAGCGMIKQPTQDNTSMQPQPETMTKQDDSMMKKEEGVMVWWAMMVKTNDIVDNAVMSKDHTTLVAAVQAWELVETLKSKGPFTVFAPTNSSFSMLPAWTVETLLKPENKSTLVNILTYHVVPGAIMAKDLKDGMKLKTVQGGELLVTYKEGKWYINNAQIEIADVVSSNGVTYVINQVLMPAK